MQDNVRNAEDCECKQEKVGEKRLIAAGILERYEHCIGTLSKPKAIYDSVHRSSSRLA